MEANETEIIRRTSYKISSWLFTLFFGLAATGLLIAISNGFEEGGGPLVAAAGFLGEIALSRRIFGSRIILRRSSVTIVNPLVTYIIPCRGIDHVDIGRTGAPTIVTRQGDEILSTGFAGSLIDYFMCTADYAVKRIEIYVKYHRGGGGDVEMKRRFTFSWIADLCTIGAAICLLMAAIMYV